MEWSDIMELRDAAIQLGKQIGYPEWLQTIGITNSEIVVYLKLKKYDKDAVPATYEGYNVRVEYMGEVRPA